MSNEKQLGHGLSNRHVQMMAIGGAIGTGLFLGSGKSIYLAGSSIILAYIITGCFIFLIMRALGELILSSTKHSSFIGFIREYLGERAAFISSWTYWFCWASIAMADLTAVGIYFQYWFPGVPQWMPGLCMLAFLLILNLTSVSIFGEMEFWFALIKVTAIVCLIAIGIYMIITAYPTPTGHVTLSNIVQEGGVFPNGIFGFILCFQMVVFAFVGVEMVGITVGETKEPRKIIPSAVNNIPIRILLFYIGAMIIIMSVYPWKEVDPLSSPFVKIFSIVGITAAAGIVNFVITCAASDAANSGLYTTSRIIYNMSRRDHAPMFFRKVNKGKSPARAVIFSAVVIFSTVFLNYFFPSGVFTLITSVSTVCFVFIWAMIIICHMKYRKGLPKGEKPFFPMPFFPWANYLILAFLVFVIVVLVLAKDTRIAVFTTPFWFIFLYFADVIRMKIHKKNNDVVEVEDY